MGEDARVLNREISAINNFIETEWVEVSLSEDTIAEDEGKLYLFPIDDHKFCLQLCYLQYEDNSSSNAIICCLRFLPSFFDQYPAETLMANQPFRFDEVTEQQFVICSQTRMLLTQLEKNNTTASFIRSLQQSESSMHLLRKALDSITVPITDSQVPACRFLAYESERDKIQEARLIIEQNLDQPQTIRELSRKVAMNECYLKKGFKSLVGKTIHEYQQELRITKAKELLQVQGLSVTDVANTLGYSSISHFSTAFKRVTGMKPCELLT
ncbi:MAG: AraC family transcriptional regulator [Flavipsychrobacter sp.]|nr:AraC family transcriptional regulator [Flavipsychrobacter sp.]